MSVLHHAGMTVSDLDRSLAFWRDALGMETVVDQESRGGYFEAIVGERDVVVRTHHLAFGGAGRPRRAVPVPLARGRAACLAPG